MHNQPTGRRSAEQRKTHQPILNSNCLEKQYFASVTEGARAHTHTHTNILLFWLQFSFLSRTFIWPCVPTKRKSLWRSTRVSVPANTLHTAVTKYVSLNPRVEAAFWNIIDVVQLMMETVRNSETSVYLHETAPHYPIRMCTYSPR
jgi:hypothetical protein